MVSYFHSETLFIHRKSYQSVTTSIYLMEVFVVTEEVSQPKGPTDEAASPDNESLSPPVGEHRQPPGKWHTTWPPKGMQILQYKLFLKLHFLKFTSVYFFFGFSQVFFFFECFSYVTIFHGAV